MVTATTGGGSPSRSSDGRASHVDEPFPIFETLSSAIVSLSESAASGNSGTSRKPSLPAMPALRATLGSLLPPPSPSMHDEHLPPREAKRKRRNRLLMTTLKGMVFTAVAVQVIRTDRNYSATLNGATSPTSTTDKAGIRSQTMRPTAQHGNRLTSDGRLTNAARAELVMREAAGVEGIVAEESIASILGGDMDPSSRPVTVVDSIDAQQQQKQQGTIDTISHIIQGTSLENDPGRVADTVEALITLPMRRVLPEEEEHQHQYQNQHPNQHQNQEQPQPPPPPFIRRTAEGDNRPHERARSLQQQDGSASTGSILGLNSILGRNPNDNEDADAAGMTKLANPYSGVGLGMHYIDVWVGSPAQKRSLAVMTGSDFTAFPCGVSISVFPFFLHWLFSSRRDRVHPNSPNLHYV